MQTNDLPAVQLLKEWVTWLIAIETAAIGGLAFASKDLEFADDVFELVAKSAATLVVVCFGCSILAAVFLLLKLPAVVQRLPPPNPGADIYSMMANPEKDRWTLAPFVKVIWILSPIGFVALAALVIMAIWFGSAPD